MATTTPAGPAGRLTQRLRAMGSPVLTAHHVSGGKYLVRAHLAAIDRAVRHAIATGGRLVIEMPPRHGKSETVSKYLPFWYLGTYPDRRVILASYEAAFAATWGGKARDLMTEFGPALWGLEPRADSRARGSWELAGHAGSMVTAGVGGPLTGKGGDLIIVDDPVKNAKEAMSPVYREAAWEWYQSTLRTRLEPGGAMILMATRWHKDDLLGRVMAESSEEWTELRLPALAEPGDPLGRGVVTCPRCEGSGAEPTAGVGPVVGDGDGCLGCHGSGQVGAALWPERYNESHLIGRQLDSAYWFSAMYQGTPRPLSGGLYDPKHRRYYRRAPDGAYLLGGGRRLEERQLRKFATVDVAASEKQSADYTVVSTWGWAQLTGDLLLLDVERVQQTTPKHRGLIRRVYEKHRHAAIGIENATYGLALLQELRNSGMPLRALPADKDKVTRALPMVALYETHQVHHPVHASWLEDYETELNDFPNGAHDDMADTAGYAAMMVADWASVRAPGEPEAAEDMNDGYQVSM